MKKKLLLVLPFIALLLGGCKGNTWSNEISSVEESSIPEPEPLTVYFKRASVPAGGYLPFSVRGLAEEEEPRFSANAQEIAWSVENENMKGRYRLVISGEKGGFMDFTVTRGDESITQTIKVYGRCDDHHEFLGQHYTYLYGDPAVDYNYQPIEEVKFYVWRSSIEYKDGSYGNTLECELVMNSSSRSYFLVDHDPLTNTFFFRNETRDAQFPLIYVKYCNDGNQRSRDYFSITLDNNNSFRVGNANWLEPYIISALFHFENNYNQGGIILGQEYLIRAEIDAYNPNSQSYEYYPEYLSIVNTDGDNFEELGYVLTQDSQDVTLFHLTVTSEQMLHHQYVLHFTSTYFISSVESEMCFLTYESETDSAIPNELQANFKAAEGGVGGSECEYNGYIYHIRYENGELHFYAWDVQTVLYPEYPISIDSMGYDEYYFSFTFTVGNFDNYGWGFAPGDTFTMKLHLNQFQSVSLDTPELGYREMVQYEGEVGYDEIIYHY